MPNIIDSMIISHGTRFSTYALQTNGQSPTMRYVAATYQYT